jgi:hypothetical protein
LAERHQETFKQVYDERFFERYGFWRAEVERTLWAFLDRESATAGQPPPSPDAETAAWSTPSQRERRRRWARLIAKVFEVDPLRCPCGATMRVVAPQHRSRPEPRAHVPPPG